MPKLDWCIFSTTTTTICRCNLFGLHQSLLAWNLCRKLWCPGATPCLMPLNWDRPRPIPPGPTSDLGQEFQGQKKWLDGWIFFYQHQNSKALYKYVTVLYRCVFLIHEYATIKKFIEWVTAKPNKVLTPIAVYVGLSSPPPIPPLQGSVFIGLWEALYSGT